jgi:hypothetical protein
MVTRREFLDALAIGATGLAVESTARSYGRILGANDRVNFAVAEWARLRSSCGA